MVKKLLLSLNLFAFLVIAILLLVTVSSSKTIQTVDAQACAAPAQPQNVLVEFPSCTGDTCSFVEAKCSWNAVSDATNYQVIITEVDSSTIVFNQQVASTVTSQVFPVTQNKTYKCDVSAVNSCGGVSTAGSHSLLCAVDALVETTPTTVPATPIPTKPPVPTVPPTGVLSNSILIGLSGVAILSVGILFFIL